MDTAGEPLRMEIYPAVDRLDQRAWDALRDPCNLLTDLDYLKAVEASQVLDCQYRYFLFSRAGEPVCALAGYRLDLDLAALGGFGNRQLLRAARRIFPNFFKIATLEIGSPIALGLTVSARSDLSPADYAAALALLEGYLHRERIALALFRDFSDPEHPLEAALCLAGYARISSVPATRMPVAWISFDSYQSALRHKYRQNQRRTQRQMHSCGITLLIANDEQAERHFAALGRLSQNVVERAQELPREQISEAYHRAMYTHFRERSRWLIYLDGERPAAYIHAIDYGGALIGQYIGLDYDVSCVAQLYFNIGYDLIRYAIEHGLSVIQAGASAYVEKSAVGFSIYPQRVYIRHKNRLFRVLARRLPMSLQDETAGCHAVFHEAGYQTIWRGKESGAQSPKTAGNDSGA